MATDKIEFKLNHPIQFGDRAVTELQLRRPRGKDIRRFNLGPNSGVADFLALAEKLAAEPPALIDELDGEDALRLANEVAGFLASSPQTGG